MAPSGILAEIGGLALLGVVLVATMVRPWGRAEAVASSLVSPSVAVAQLRALGPTVGFLAAILLLGHLADREGVFHWVGDRLATASLGPVELRPTSFLRVVFAAAALTTAVLNCRGPIPWFALTVLAISLLGSTVADLVGLEPVWVALAGALVLAARALIRRETTTIRLVRAAAPLFCAFVLALGVVVAAVSTHGLGRLLTVLLPATPTLLGLLAVAGLAALLANVVNNLPATLLLLGALGPGAHPAMVLAMLLGVNVGPNLTYTGSLAPAVAPAAHRSDGPPPPRVRTARRADRIHRAARWGTDAVAGLGRTSRWASLSDNSPRLRQSGNRGRCGVGITDRPVRHGSGRSGSCPVTNQSSRRVIETPWSANRSKYLASNATSTPTRTG